MKVFRLSKKKYCKDLSGKGAEIAGGRWNNKGTALLYTSQSRALCTTEVAVHTPLGIVPDDYFLSIIEIPDQAAILEVKADELPEDWKSFPHPQASRQIGDRFVEEAEYLVLKVPSAVVQGDFNYLINPLHPDFKEVKLLDTEPFTFDRRLFK
jgi:RES domain-containing protein